MRAAAEDVTVLDAEDELLLNVVVAREHVVQVLEWLTGGYDGPDEPGEQLTVISTLQDATEALGQRWVDTSADGYVPLLAQ